MIFIAANDRGRSKVAALGAGNANGREPIAVALLAILDQDRLSGADQTIEPAYPPLCSYLAEAGGPGLDDLALELRHSGCGRVRPRRKGKYVNRHDIAVVEQLQRILRGFLGLSPDVRKGYSAVRVRMRVKTKADAEQIKALVQMSPVYDVVSRSVPVSISIETY